VKPLLLQLVQAMAGQLQQAEATPELAQVQGHVAWPWERETAQQPHSDAGMTEAGCQLCGARPRAAIRSRAAAERCEEREVAA
jgi:hypothetical protein